MKKLIEETKQLDNQERVVDKIVENGLLYVQNEFGNFVVSEVLNRFPHSVCDKIFTQILGHFVKLS